jgi:hypothetical protein
MPAGQHLRHLAPHGRGRGIPGGRRDHLRAQRLLPARRAASHASAKAGSPSAIATTCAYWRATSAMGVLTTGRSAARYSSVFVGLMKRVDSLSAKGSRHTSHCATRSGSSS